MDAKLACALIVGAIVAGLLLGRGITGFVAVGSSCCVGDECPADQVCMFAQPHLESPAAVHASADLWRGLGVLALTVSLLWLHRRR